MINTHHHVDHSGGNLMGVYGEGIGGFGSRNFTFTDPKDPGKIKEDKAAFKLPVSVEEWPKFWKHGEWNELKARITGNPPTVTSSPLPTRRSTGHAVIRKSAGKIPIACAAPCTLR